MKYLYRKEFHLDAYQYEQEPADQLFTNLAILRMIRDKERLLAENG